MVVELEVTNQWVCVYHHNTSPEPLLNETLGHLEQCLRQENRLFLTRHWDIFSVFVASKTVITNQNMMYRKP